MTLQKLPRPRVNVSVYKYDKVVMELELCQNKLQRLRKETARLNGIHVQDELLKAELREEIENLLDSATPNPKDHPTMWAAWLRARTLLAR